MNQQKGGDYRYMKCWFVYGSSEEPSVEVTGFMLTPPCA